jgi:hypothetical protein
MVRSETNPISTPSSSAWADFRHGRDIDECATVDPKKLLRIEATFE